MKRLSLSNLDIDLAKPDGTQWTFPAPDGEARWLVALAYRGDWCPFCCIQLADYGFQFSEFVAAGALVVGISSDSPTQVDELRQNLFLPYDLVVDSEGEWFKTVGIWSADEGCPWPTTIVIDRESNVHYSLIGGHPSDRPVASEILVFIRERERD